MFFLNRSQIKIFLFLSLLFQCSMCYAMDREVSVRVFTYTKPDSVSIQPVAGKFTLPLNDQGINIDIDTILKVKVINNKINLRFATQNVSVDTLKILKTDPDDNLISIKGPARMRVYRGDIILYVFNSKLLMVNRLPLEEYLMGVLPRELEATAPMAALQAQAIVSRSYALANIGRHQESGYDYCDLTHCQVYHGYEIETIKTNNAIEVTKNLVLKVKGKILETFYTANCGGRTARAIELWGFRGAVVSVQDDWCKNSPNYKWDYFISLNDMFKILHGDRRTDPGSFLADIIVTKRGESNRVVEIHVIGERTVTVDGYSFWSALARKLKWGKIKSTLFEISKSSEGFNFSGTGYGHGVGFCQSGAFNRALHGQSYQEIIKAYFPNAEIVQLPD